MYPTVLDMLLLTSVLAGTVAAVAFIAVLVREGFRHGDRPGDPRVRSRTLAAAGPGTAGRWLEVTITNPSAATALVALSVRRSRFRWTGAETRRRTAGRRARLSLGERVLGVVSAGESSEFHLWAEGDHRRLRLLVAVGTPGRLRLHRIPLPEPVAAEADEVGRRLLDPRAPALP